MCLFGSARAAEPTVSAKDSINSTTNYVPATRPDSPVAQLFRVKARGAGGVMGNVTQAAHLTDEPSLADPQTTKTTLGAGTTQRDDSDPVAKLKSTVGEVASNVYSKLNKYRKRYT